jgi:N-acetylglucosamine kinase
MTPCVVGVDGGGTKTACEITSLDGATLAWATGGPSNYQTIGAEATEAVLFQTIGEASRAAGGELHARALCLAMAGVDRPDDLQAVRAIAARLLAEPVGRLHWATEAAQVLIVNDAVASLVGGTGRKYGVVTVAGTGSIAFGMNTHGERRRAGGWGYLLGDEGSGYAIGLAGLRAVCRADDGRGPHTALRELVLHQYQLPAPADLISRAYGEWGVPQIASVAPLVFQAADSGDAVARAIVEAAADELALASGAVVRSLHMADDQFEVVTAGGTWQGSALLRERFAGAVAAFAPRAAVIPPRAEPVAGAVLLAREALGVVSLD